MIKKLLKKKIILLNDNEIRDKKELIKRIKVKHQIELDELNYKHRIELSELKFKHDTQLKKLRNIQELELLEHNMRKYLS